MGKASLRAMFNVSVGSDGQSHRTCVCVCHNLLVKRQESAKRYRTEVLPLTTLEPNALPLGPNRLTNPPTLAPNPHLFKRKENKSGVKPRSLCLLVHGDDVERNDLRCTG